MNRGIVNEIKSLNKFGFYCVNHEPILIWREMSGIRDLEFDGEIELTTKDDKGRSFATGEIYKIVIKATLNISRGLPVPRYKPELLQYYKNSNFNIILVAYSIKQDKLYAKNINSILIRSNETSQAIKYTNEDELILDSNDFITKHIVANREKLILEKPIKTDTKYGNKPLSRRLDCCPCGENDWREYENICTGIVDYLFGSTFRNFSRIVQSKNENGLDIKDLVIPNRSSNPFWQEVRMDYAARNIVFEFKNYCKPIGKNQLIQISNYLKKKTYGRFAIIFSRKGLSKNGIEEQKELLRDDDKMVIVLNDIEIKELLNIRNKGQSAEKMLEDLKTDLELKI